MNAVHLLIEEWVDRQPEACAVRDASTKRELTFRQLWLHSGHLADQLHARGVKPGDIVVVLAGSLHDPEPVTDTLRIVRIY